MPDTKLINLVFCGGGPWDGRELVGQRPPESRFRIASGTYHLTHVQTCVQRDEPPETMFYDWKPLDQ
jgi:hypothetical protein